MWARGASARAIAAVGLSLVAGAAHAEAVIGPGREADVLALIAPHRPGVALAPGVVLGRVQIHEREVVYVVRLSAAAAGGAEASAALRLRPRPLARQADGPKGPAFSLHPDAATGPLGDGLAALSRAVLTNDDGRFPFLAAVDSRTAARPTSVPQGSRWERYLALALWALWAVAGLLAVWLWVRRAGQPLAPRRWAPWVAALALFAVAAWARWRLGFTPLHANGHAFEDAAASLGVDGAAALSRLDAIYGPALRLAQRASVALTGAHLDGLATAGALWGGLAAVLCASAVAALAGRLGGILAGLAMALLPLALRLAASESDLVVAQALIAAALLAAVAVPSAAEAGSPWLGRARDLCLAAALGLLALGHVLGPPMAATVAATAVSLRHAAALAAAPPLGPDTPRLGPVARAAATEHASAAASAALRLGLPLIAVGALCGGLRLHTALEHVADRGGIGIALEATMLLFTDGDWFAPGLAACAVLGLVGDLAARQPAPALATVRSRLLGLAGTLALWLGAIVALFSMLVICASTTDAVRYQGALLPVVLTWAARLPSLLSWITAMMAGSTQPSPVASAGTQRQRLATWALGLVLAADIAWPRAGADFQDSQGAGWRAVRPALVALGADLTLVSPRHRGPAPVVIETPRGAISAIGPELARLREEDLRAACEARLALPANLYVLLPPACEARGADCGGLRRLRLGSAPVAAGRVDVAPYLDRERPRAEFSDFQGGSAAWSLWRAGCPGRGGSSTGDAGNLAP